MHQRARKHKKIGWYFDVYGSCSGAKYTTQVALLNPRSAVVPYWNIGVLKIEQDNQNTYRTSEYSFGELRMNGVHIRYVLYAQIHR